MASSAELTLNLLNVPEVRRLAGAAAKVVAARNGGADVYGGLEQEVADLESALQALGIQIPERWPYELEWADN